MNERNTDGSLRYFQYSVWVNGNYIGGAYTEDAAFALFWENVATRYNDEYIEIDHLDNHILSRMGAMTA